MGNQALISEFFEYEAYRQIMAPIWVLERQIAKETKIATASVAKVKTLSGELKEIAHQLKEKVKSNKQSETHLLKMRFNTTAHAITLLQNHIKLSESTIANSTTTINTILGQYEFGGHARDVKMVDQKMRSWIKDKSVIADRLEDQQDEAEEAIIRNNDEADELRAATRSLHMDVFDDAFLNQIANVDDAGDVDALLRIAQGGGGVNVGMGSASASAAISSSSPLTSVRVVMDSSGAGDQTEQKKEQPRESEQVVIV